MYKNAICKVACDEYFKQAAFCATRFYGLVPPVSIVGAVT
jgi:hypothetical protein